MRRCIWSGWSCILGTRLGLLGFLGLVVLLVIGFERKKREYLGIWCRLLRIEGLFCLLLKGGGG